MIPPFTGTVSVRSHPVQEQPGNSIGLEAIIRKALMGKYDENEDRSPANATNSMGSSVAASVPVADGRADDAFSQGSHAVLFWAQVRHRFKASKSNWNAGLCGAWPSQFFYVCLQVGGKPLRAAGARTAGRPNPRDRACQEGRDPPPCPRSTPRETVTDELHLPTVFGRTGPHPQVSHSCDLMTRPHSVYIRVNVLTLCFFAFRRSCPFPV